MPNRAHSYRLTSEQFDSVIQKFQFASKTVKSLRAILVDGKTYQAAGIIHGCSKQFLYPRVHQVLRCAKALGYLS